MKDTLRVAMIIQAYFPRLGGAERQLASLSPLLQQSGVEICILTRRYQASLPSFEKIGTVPVYRLPVPGPKPVAALSFSLSALPIIQKFKPDVIHAHELLSPATTAIMAKRIFRTPVVAKVLRGGELGDLAKLKSRGFSSQRINALKKSIDSFIVISREIDHELAGIGVPDEKRCFIPNGVDLDRFASISPDEKDVLRQKLGLPNGLIAIYAGRLDVEKRVNYLIEIWPLILKSYPDATLLILGTGTEESSLKQVAGANIRFEGNVLDVSPYLRASDLFVLPSSTEGLSNSLLEALACGLPAIATSVGGAPDIIDHGRTGLLIPPDDRESLLSAFFTLLADPQLRSELGRRGREKIQQDYSLKAVAAKLKLLYQSMTARRA